MSYDYSVIGKRIRQARENKGFTQEQLAESLDVSNAYISKIERGKTPINLDRLSELCLVLEQRPEYILGGADNSNREYMRTEMLAMLDGCSAEKIKLISRIIKLIVDYKE